MNEHRDAKSETHQRQRVNLMPCSGVAGRGIPEGHTYHIVIDGVQNKRL